MCHGVFDILHLGHIKHFEEAKSQGDVLFVSVTSNKYVNKGFDRPYFDLNTRMEALAGIKHIDYVVPSDFPTAEKNLNILKPSATQHYVAYVNKPDITQNLIKEKKICKKFNSNIYFTKGIQHSSSKLINSFSDTFDENKGIFKKIKIKFYI